MSSPDESPTAGEDERKLERRPSLESQVNSGLGSKTKKQQNVEAFYSSVWPILESAGWTLVSVMLLRGVVILTVVYCNYMFLLLMIYEYI